MGTRISLKFADRSFASKKAADEALRQIRDSVPDKVDLPEEYFPFLSAVLFNHPQWEIKCGTSPIVAFYVDTVPEYQNRCFHLRRADGTVAEWSWKECLSPTSWGRQLHAACRVEIRRQVEAARKAYFLDAHERPCQISGVLMRLPEAHADHEEPTFADLVESFVSIHRLTSENCGFSGFADGEYQLKFLDRTIAKSWFDYHLANANLRVVLSSENLSRKRKQH